MIRRLIILLLIVGCVFGDPITYNQGNNKRTIKNVKFTRAGNGKVYFKAHGRETSRYCNKIIKFTDDDGNPIEYNCNAVIVEESLIELEKKIEGAISTSDVKSIIKETKKPSFGGMMIAIGGAILIYQNEKDDIDDLEEFKNTTTIAYALITIGGLVLTFGI